ncbi:hypothetical protein F5877DRAFT_73265 [Lentinula edodes]|nr:hypothetical protein F5877DRAFT_73265 [Lentinula edodes]
MVPRSRRNQCPNSLRAAQSASQQPKYPEQVQNFALSALGAGKYSPASTLALANILVLQMCPAKVIEGRLWKIIGLAVEQKRIVTTLTGYCKLVMVQLTHLNIVKLDP